MRARHWLIGGAALLVTLVVALAAALALLDWNKARPWISEQVKERTGRDLAIGRLEVHPFSFYPGIEADDVTLSNAEWGDKVSVAIELRPGTALTLEELQRWARERLAPYKVPRLLCTVSALPRNAMGKVMKPEVMKLF